MTKKDIAKQYILYLKNGNTNKIIALFNDNGVVDSPLYGIKKAHEFYLELNNDTSSSELFIKGIFEAKDSNQLALYFTYIWTLKDNKKVEFDVVDIIEFDTENKIKLLTIIYDTVIARKLLNELKA